jgi:protein-tyrosine phosphatase/ribose 5-phosphate isomerase B
MAEGLLKKMAQENQIPLEVQSAGLAAFAGVPAALEAVEACREKRIDISGHESQPLSKTLVMESDLILTMTGKHKEMILKKMPTLENKVALLSEFAGSGTRDVEDPVGQPLESYRETLAQMEGYLRKALERLRS